MTKGLLALLLCLPSLKTLPLNPQRGNVTAAPQPALPFPGRAQTSDSEKVLETSMELSVYGEGRSLLCLNTDLTPGLYFTDFCVTLSYRIFISEMRMVLTLNRAWEACSMRRPRSRGPEGKLTFI